ncbi:PDR/VanB family oxidoreductase [Hydrogenophaga sp.]|uniref:PDR/VanB family oxidoreductase n=1 Tax=Hydrogenophaga sp. TaxID=1904254 RepID=UPI0027209818|nr:PDR/VanB family oxidoreductase [Hydrogenophaga sp.]MDO9436546.1 PDR/VanB family oxidoreductase [Hydrogenophaga sp.]
MKTLELMVRSIRKEADTVHSFELESPDGAPLPAFTAGAHIDLQLGERLVRSYSLANDPAEHHRYVVAIHREHAGRGGSAHMHEKVMVGQRLRVTLPSNDFALDETAPHTVLIAGGIGITPMRAMLHRLEAIGKPWTLWYGGRARSSMAYLADIERLQSEGKDVHVHVDSEQEGRVVDMARIVAEAVPGAHFYCCGPKPMLAAFEAATQPLPADQVHLEYFSAQEAAAAEGGFTLDLARSGKQLPVAPGASVLDTLLDAGVQIEFSCMDGICGSCEVRVLAGEPDHRDSVFSAEERARNDRMLVCCSGSKSPVLVLDL